MGSRGSKAKLALVKDPKKEGLFRELSEKLSVHGFVVRREDLKAGHGWKVISGGCRLDRERYIFVDRKIPQDDQIDFLKSKLTELGEALPDATVKSASQGVPA